MIKSSESILRLLLTLVLLILTGCSQHIKYDRGAISGETRIAIFSWRVRPYVSSTGLAGTIANTLLGETKSKYQELNSIASEEFVEKDMLEGISKVIPGNHFIIQSSDYILDSEGRVDLEATGKKNEADVVLEMSTWELAKDKPDPKYGNSLLTYWQANLEVEAKMWRLSDKEILWQKKCRVSSEIFFGKLAFEDCSKLAVRCLMNDIEKP